MLGCLTAGVLLLRYRRSNYRFPQRLHAYHELYNAEFDDRTSPLNVIPARVLPDTLMCVIQSSLLYHGNFVINSIKLCEVRRSSFFISSGEKEPFQRNVPEPSESFWGGRYAVRTRPSVVRVRVSRRGWGRRGCGENGMARGAAAWTLEKPKRNGSAPPTGFGEGGSLHAAAAAALQPCSTGAAHPDLGLGQTRERSPTADTGESRRVRQFSR